MSIFCCPLCSAPLVRRTNRYCCPNGHCFDIASQGYTHLLPANRMHSKLPGDDAGMVAARSNFLSKGYYAPLLDKLCQVILNSVKGNSLSNILDCGCGEGYYTAGIFSALSAAGQPFRLAGIDISKFAVRRAAKKCKAGEFAVASAYHLPVMTGSIDLLLNVFAPLSAEEFFRVLKPGGVFIYVVPSARHLWQMKQVLYPHPYENAVQQTPYPGFRYQAILPVRYEITLPCQEDIHALFQMTPYYWKTPKKGAEALGKLTALNTEIAFDIHVFTKEEEQL